MRCLVLALLLACSGCQHSGLQVKQIAAPDYPVEANARNIQGMVQVKVSIGADGKVLFAKGSGAHPILVQAAEENARQWIFGPFPAVAEFPIDYTITYIYRLQGKPLSVMVHPTVKTYLPERVEIQAVPFESDYPPLDTYRPIPKLGSEPKK